MASPASPDPSPPELSFCFYSPFNVVMASVVALIVVAPSADAGWPEGWIISALGLLAVGRLASVRFAATADTLLVRNFWTTRHVPAADVASLTVTRFDEYRRRNMTAIEVIRKPERARVGTGRIRCSAATANSRARAERVCRALQAWADVNDVPCDATADTLADLFEPQRLTPQTRWDRLVQGANLRLVGEMAYAPTPPAPDDPPLALTLSDRADTDPAGAVEAAYRRVDAEVRRIAARHAIDEADLQRLILRCYSARLVHRAAPVAFEQLVSLRRLVERGELVPDPARARRFLRLADDVLAALRLPPQR